MEASRRLLPGLQAGSAALEEAGPMTQRPTASSIASRRPARARIDKADLATVPPSQADGASLPASFEGRHPGVPLFQAVAAAGSVATELACWPVGRREPSGGPVACHSSTARCRKRSGARVPRVSGRVSTSCAKSWKPMAAKSRSIRRSARARLSPSAFRAGFPQRAARPAPPATPRNSRCAAPEGAAVPRQALQFFRL